MPTDLAEDMSMIKIAIIGAGQLGSRHLQALNLVQTNLDITVIDPNQESLNTAKSRFEASVGQVKHQITYQSHFDIADDLFIAIVASTSSTRRQIIESLLAQTKLSHLILEKLLFTRFQDYCDVETLLAKTQSKVWVNCCMRMMPFYNQLVERFSNTAIQYRVSGSQYGLITNAIHYLDHVAQLTGSNDYQINTAYLDKQIIPSKRPGFYEVTGTLIAEFGNGSLAVLQSAKEGNAPVQIEIYNHEHRVISRETEHKAWVASAQEDWQWREQQAQIPFQSTLTADLVNSLLQDNLCQLPDYATSKHIHLQLLAPLKQFLLDNGINNLEVDYPFT